MPFEIPDSWRWVRLGDVVVPESGLAYKKEDLAIKSKSMVRVLRGGNIQDGNCIFKDDDVFIAREKIKGCTTIHAFDYVLPAVTSQVHLGKTAFFQGDYEDVCAGGFLLMLHLIYKDINFAKHLLLYFQCRTYKDYCKTIANKSGQAFFNLSRQKLVQALFPLPPLAEQKRIVAKIEKLMPLVEEYGKLEEKRLQLDADLPATLEKSILQEAIQGKLVSQDPNDEPASELLKRIAAERKALVKAGNLKRDKGESVIFRGSDRLAYETRNGETMCIQDEIPFEIPDSWEWVRLGDILHPMTSKKPTGEKFDYIDIDAIDNKQHIVKVAKTLQTKGATSRASREVKSGDVLFSMVRPYLRNIALIDEGYAHCIASTGFYVCRPSDVLYPPYLYHLMLSDYVVMGLNESMKGLNSPGITTGDLQRFPIPLPPLAEQKRIVAKIEDLRAVIKSLTT